MLLNWIEARITSVDLVALLLLCPCFPIQKAYTSSPPDKYVDSYKGYLIGMLQKEANIRPPLARFPQ